MKQLFKMIACVCLFSTAHADISNPQKTILVTKESSEFTITLASNPSTGFVWLLESYDPHLLKVKKHDYVAPVTKNKVGVSGVETWEFAARKDVIGPRVTKITLIHARPWEVDTTTTDKEIFTVVLD